MILPRDPREPQEITTFKTGEIKPENYTKRYAANAIFLRNSESCLQFPSAQYQTNQSCLRYLPPTFLLIMTKTTEVETVLRHTNQRPVMTPTAIMQSLLLSRFLRALKRYATYAFVAEPRVMSSILTYAISYRNQSCLRHSPPTLLTR